MLWLLFLLALAGVGAGFVGPGVQGLWLIAGPMAMASLLALLMAAKRRSPAPDKPRIVVDGSNVMYW